MKALSRSTLLLLLSSTGFCIASGAVIRAGSGVEDETPQELLNHDVAEADEHPTASADISGDPSHVLKKIAELYNISIEEAKELRGLQRDFDLLVDDISEDVNFLQAEGPMKLHEPFVLMFKNGKVPEKGQEGIKKFREKNKNTKLEIVHSRLSLEEAEDRGKRVLAKLESKGHSQVGFFIHGDDLEVWVKKPRRERSLGEVEGDDNGKMSFLRTAEILDLDHDDRDLEGLEMHMFEHDDKDPVFEHEDEDLAIDQGKDGTHSTQERPGTRNLGLTSRPVVAGSQLWYYGFANCTSAFVVQKKKGSKKCGVLTAGHCRDFAKVRSSLREHSPLITIEEEKRSITKKGEYKWYSFDTSKNRATNRIYVKQFADGHSQSAHVTKVAKQAPKVGFPICVWSRRKGETMCGTIRSQSGTVNDPKTGQKFEQVAQVQHAKELAKKGDSGGPWFNYDENDSDIVAHGVHGGEYFCATLGVRCYFFSKIKFVENKLGVKVVTDPEPSCNP